MAVRKVNFTKAREIYDEKYEEIFNTKNSKIHFALFGDEENDGVVDGAGDKWKNISFMDALMTIAIDQCPEGHRIKRRSFDQFKCTKYSFKMSTFVNSNNHSSNVKSIKLDDLEIYDMPIQYQSARGFMNYLVPDYRGDMERTRRKMSRQFYSQLKELASEVVIDDALSFVDKLDYLIDAVDKSNLFIKAIIKAIEISLLYDENDFIYRHWEIIEELADSLVIKTKVAKCNDSTDDDSFDESPKKKVKRNNQNEKINKSKKSTTSTTSKSKVKKSKDIACVERSTNDSMIIDEEYDLLYEINQIGSVDELFPINEIEQYHKLDENLNIVNNFVNIFDVCNDHEDQVVNTLEKSDIKYDNSIDFACTGLDKSTDVVNEELEVDTLIDMYDLYNEFNYNISDLLPEFEDLTYTKLEPKAEVKNNTQFDEYARIRTIQNW
eukprot:CAMPEP_0196764034 /NCGR_PEP_ID=MMETSP1095-20130614/5273_1 /TAXON_ID=96789 ORGANISM="Chromulina nebulosa, Strain UTEXLB2642" /NCGR_SAMPLE_ID=MMETSP1095 /ASSEMBLY_ACC=CAM_ASM_000446 /LENGTH=436 /DNA_ID=CAMNT_0042118585 /DNA_START=20 /DNA_END=1330 /DNA_ORIENTATION=-